jgi:methionyl-tRNA formyltransferase
MSKISAVFFGTQKFAAVILQKILTADFIGLKAVITQPDRAVGRKQEVIKSPVKLLAEQNNIAVFQPESLKNISASDIPEADIYLVCQYGLIIPKNIVEKPKYGSLNVHASLLPLYRGASPIQAAIINDDKETGITIMLMDEKMDHGPILSQQKLCIDGSEDASSLSARLAQTGADMLITTISGWVNGEIKAVPQEGEPTFCKLLSKDDGRIDFNKSNDEIYNLYRGLNPWPGIWTTWNNKRLKLIKISKTDRQIPAGTVLVDAGRIFIGCQSGSIEVFELQPEGKNIMDAKSFINGYQTFNNAVLG